MFSEFIKFVASDTSPFIHFVLFVFFLFFWLTREDTYRGYCYTVTPAPYMRGWRSTTTSVLSGRYQTASDSVCWRAISDDAWSNRPCSSRGRRKRSCGTYGRSTYVNSSTLMDEYPLPGHQCPLGVAHSAVENILTCAITTPCNNEGCASSSLLAVPQPQNRQSWAGRIWLLCWQSCRWTRSLDLLVRNSTRHYPVGFCSNRSKSRMGGQGPPATGV